MRYLREAYISMVRRPYNPKKLPRVGTTGVTYGKLSVKNVMSYEAYK